VAAKSLTRDEVEQVLNEHVRPLLKADGGDIRLERVGDDGKVFVSLVGRCAGCPGSGYTMSSLVKRCLGELPKVKQVVLLPWQLAPRD